MIGWRIEGMRIINSPKESHWVQFPRRWSEDRSPPLSPLWAWPRPVIHRVASGSRAGECLGWDWAELKTSEISICNQIELRCLPLGMVFEVQWVREHINKKFGANQACKPEGGDWIQDDCFSLALFDFLSFQKQMSCLNSSRDSSIPRWWSLYSLGWHSKPFAI